MHYMHVGYIDLHNGYNSFHSIFDDVISFLEEIQSHASVVDNQPTDIGLSLVITMQPRTCSYTHMMNEDSRQIECQKFGVKTLQKVFFTVSNFLHASYCKHCEQSSQISRSGEDTGMLKPLL